jgi:hypothetical protein
MKRWMESLKALRRGRPGHRFQEWHRSQRRRVDGWGRVLTAFLGLLLVLVGLLLMAMPGPGLLVALVGLTLLGSTSLTVARALDRAELWLGPAWRRLRQRWGNRPPRGPR